MTLRSALLTILFGVSSTAVLHSIAASQSSAASTGSQVWPELDVHMQFPRNFRILAYGGAREGLDYPYQQTYVAAGLGYQLKPIAKPHVENIDPDKERYFVFGAGYQFLRTSQSEKTKNQNRIGIESIMNVRPTTRFLMRDRNRVEFRWNNGVYSTTYRQQFSAEYNLQLHGIRFDPYSSAEVFYSGSQNSWNQERYTAGLQWPFKPLFMLRTYYLRQHCTTCSPTNLNIAGVTMNFYFSAAK